MYLRLISNITFAATSILLPFTSSNLASAQAELYSSCIHMTNSNTNSCSTRTIQVTPSAYPIRISAEHEFELFNNSSQDILFLHLIPLNSPAEEMVFGGTRKLAPGRAWSVNLSHGCEYSMFVEYEDGTQNFYEEVNTCDHRGIQLR